MTVKRLIAYAEKRDIRFNGEKDRRGFYKAYHPDGGWSSSPTLEGLKTMIDKY